MGTSSPDAQPQQAGGPRVHHDLVAAGRVGHPPGEDANPVLIEVQAVDAGHGRHREARGDAGRQRRAAGAEHVGDGLHGRFRVPHQRQARDDAGERRQARGRVGLRVLNGEVGRVRAGEEHRERRLGAPGGRGRPQRDAAGQPDDQDQPQVAGPAAAQRDSQPVPGGPQDVHATSVWRASGPLPIRPTGHATWCHYHPGGRVRRRSAGPAGRLPRGPGRRSRCGTGASPRRSARARPATPARGRCRRSARHNRAAAARRTSAGR